MALLSCLVSVCVCVCICLAAFQGYYRRGDANFMLGKFKEALKDLKTVSTELSVLSVLSVLCVLSVLRQ